MEFVFPVLSPYFKPLTKAYSIEVCVMPLHHEALVDIGQGIGYSSSCVQVGGLLQNQRIHATSPEVDTL